MNRLLILICFVLSLSQIAQAQSSAGDEVEGGFSFLGGWGVSYFSVGGVQNMRPGQKEPDTRSIETYNYFSFNKKLTSSKRFAVRIPFTFSTEGTNSYGDNEPSSLDLQNVHFVWTDYDWGYWGDVDFQGKVKLYLPTSEFSQASKMVTQIRLEFVAEYTVAPGWELRYEGKPDFYWQRQTTSLNPDAQVGYDGSYAWDPRQTTQQYGFEQMLTLTSWITSEVGIDGGFSFDEAWYYSSSVENVGGLHTTKFIPVLGIKYSSRAFFIRFSVANSHRLGSNRGDDLKYFLPENTEYTIMLNAALF